MLPPFRIAGAQTVLGVLLGALGVATAVFAYLRWSANEQAMRTARKLSYSITLPLLSAALGLTGLVILVVVITGRK